MRNESRIYLICSGAKCVGVKANILEAVQMAQEEDANIILQCHVESLFHRDVDWSIVLEDLKIGALNEYQRDM